MEKRYMIGVFATLICGAVVAVDSLKKSEMTKQSKEKSISQNCSYYYDYGRKQNLSVKTGEPVTINYHKRQVIGLKTGRIYDDFAYNDYVEYIREMNKYLREKGGHVRMVRCHEYLYIGKPRTTCLVDNETSCRYEIDRNFHYNTSKEKFFKIELFNRDLTPTGKTKMVPVEYYDEYSMELTGESLYEWTRGIR